MKKLREIHLYLGCLFAPVLIFFAVTGAWQLFALHRGVKDGSYAPPRPAVVLSSIHEVQHLSGTSQEAPTPLRYFILAATIGLVGTTTLGILMAFRYGRSRASTIACLLAGVVIPVAILLIYR
jgi:ABC-type nitrate/sulfonate/bicarbonate transport system permease component